MNNQLTPRINSLETNVILDGGMDFWPQGDSLTWPNNSGGHTSSMFKFYNNSTGVTVTSAKSNLVPNTQLLSSNRISKTSAGSVAAGTTVQFDYTVEGYDTLNIYKEDFSVLFWVKSSVAAARSVAVRNSTASHSYVKTYTINQVDTWELKVLKFKSLESAPGITYRDNGAGAFISFPIVTGSNYQTAFTDQWVSGSFTCATGQDTTWLTGTVHDFLITGVMVLPGDWTAMQSNPASYKYLRAGRNWADEFDMISRYVEVLQGSSSPIGSAYTVNATTARAIVMFRTTKRAVPTITASSNVGFRYYSSENAHLSTNITATSPGQSSFICDLTHAGGATLHRSGYIEIVGSSFLLIDARI